MATLGSTSTLEEIVAAYADNASYAEDGSAEKARGFVTACRLLLLRKPRRVSHGGAEIELDLSLIAKELEAAQQWSAVGGGTAGGAKYASFRGFRD